MKIKLILFFVGACMAQYEDYDPLDEYPLLQHSFADMATLRYLDGYLVSKGKAVVTCYINVKGKLDEIANIFKKNLTNAEKGILQKVVRTYLKVAQYLINLLKDISDKLKSCQNAVWIAIENSLFEKAAEMLWTCKPEISKLIKRYESNMNNIKDEKSREIFKKKMDEIIAEIEKKYENINDSFEKCINGTSSTP